jgi:hypothetical protein
VPLDCLENPVEAGTRIEKESLAMDPTTAGSTSPTRGRLGWSVLLLLCLLIPIATRQAPPAYADENKILTVTKDALYGAGAGLLLSGVTTLVVAKDSRSDVLRWGIVIGTFGGFAYGVYEVHTRSKNDGFSGFPPDDRIGKPARAKGTRTDQARAETRVVGRPNDAPLISPTPGLHSFLPGTLTGGLRRIGW